MSKYRISDRVGLVQFCLRKLGAPIVKINVTEEQIDDRVNTALQLYTKHHMDGSYRKVYVHTITQNDIDSKAITLTENIIAVLGVYLPNETSAALLSLNNLQQVSYFSDVVKRSVTGDITGYAVTQSYLKTLNSILPTVEKISNYNIHNSKLRVNLQWNYRKVGDLIGIECYLYDDVDEIGFVYDDYWLKEYTTALIKEQWGTNLTKFNGYTLVGGGELNGQGILDQAKAEIAELENKLFDQFSYPIDAFTY